MVDQLALSKPIGEEGNKIRDLKDTGVYWQLILCISER